MFLASLYCITFLLSKFLGIEFTASFLRRLGIFFRFFKKQSLDLDAISVRLQKGLSRVPLATKCLDQALVAWFYLNLNQHPAVLKIGLSITPLESHAWVVSGTRVFVDTYNRTDLTVVAEYPCF